MNNTNQKLNKSIKIALLAAIATILMFIEIPLIPMFAWLKLDLSEVPVLLGAFGYGPLAGVIIEGVKILLHLLLKGTQTGGAGEIANFLIGISLIVPASYIYVKNKSKKTAIIGMIIGGLIMEIVAIFSNIYIILPIYNMKMNTAELMQYISIGLIPFNALKAILVNIITFIVYKKVSLAIFKVDAQFGSKKKIQG
ncbi:ECF transporter S component [uncultured Clostridium sp.]|uniref:ECF transporter S component n=1 Tax=uncultured Clostridium sp. TaxID=59620 RepID=UPI0025F83C86|nr:ECF transporter S component [uncultured Clostridium sp.]